MKKIICLFVFAAFCAVNHAVGQVVADTSLYRVETREGNIYTGTVIMQDEISVKLMEQKLGEIVLQKVDISKMEKIEPKRIIEGVYWAENQHCSRYFWAPNAYGTKAGEGYYQNAWIFFNQFNVGITDNISLGGGLIPMFLFPDAPTPLWLTSKLTLPVIENQFNVGAGALVGTIFGDEENASFGILFGLTTVGSRDYNLNLGLGYGYAGDNWAKNPVINISTMLRTGERGFIMSENYIFPAEDGYYYLFSVGARQLIKKVALDYGLIIPMSNDMEDLFALPFIGLYIPFAKKTVTKIK